MHAQTIIGNKFLLAVLVTIFVTACGGGGGGGGGGAPPIGFQPPPPPDKTISGNTMLGPVANADVELSGTGGVLGSGTTTADGTFGPISFSDSYDGPLRITVTGNAASTWICDFFIGCLSNNAILPPGSSINFDGTLEAVLPSAIDGQFVSVSMLSNFAAVRTDVLGGLTATNVNDAYADIADTIRSVLGDVINDLGLVLPDLFASVELFDLQNVPAPGGTDDALSALLTLFNSGLMGLASPLATTGTFIDQISNDIANQPILSVSDPNFFAASMESMLNMFVIQTAEAANAGGALSAAIDALLAPDELNAVILSAINTLFAMPTLELSFFDLFIDVDDVALQNPIFRELEVTTTTGEQLQLADFGVDDIEFGPVGNWMSTSAVIIGGLPHVRIDFNNPVIAAMPNGIYEGIVEVYSNSGEFARGGVFVTLTVQIP